MRFLMLAAGTFESSDFVQGEAYRKRRIDYTNRLVGNEDTPLLDFLHQTISLSPELSNSISYAISYCTLPSDPLLPALKRTRRYAQSVGRYGSGAFLVGQYGGAGEVAQGFCRACAVFGGTYVLGESARPRSIKLDDTSDKLILDLPCHPRPVTANHIVSSAEHIPSSIVPDKREGVVHRAHCIAVLSSLPPVFTKRGGVSEGEGEEMEEDDTAVVIFPPVDDLPVVRALLMGEGTGSCPAGQCQYLAWPVYGDKLIPLQSSYTSTQPFQTLQSILSSCCGHTSVDWSQSRCSSRTVLRAPLAAISSPIRRQEMWSC